MEIIKKISNIYNNKTIFKSVKLPLRGLWGPLNTAQNSPSGGRGAKKYHEKENNDCCVFDGYDDHYRTQFMHRPS
jgi:hypothetical protein